MQVVVQLIEDDDVAVFERIEPRTCKCEYLLRAVGFLVQLQLHGRSVRRIVPQPQIHHPGPGQFLLHLFFQRGRHVVRDHSRRKFLLDDPEPGNGQVRRAQEFEEPGLAAIPAIFQRELVVPPPDPGNVKVFGEPVEHGPQPDAVERDGRGQEQGIGPRRATPDFPVPGEPVAELEAVVISPGALSFEPELNPASRPGVEPFPRHGGTGRGKAVLVANTLREAHHLERRRPGLAVRVETERRHRKLAEVPAGSGHHVSHCLKRLKEVGLAGGVGAVDCGRPQQRDRADALVQLRGHDVGFAKLLAGAGDEAETPLVLDRPEVRHGEFDKHRPDLHGEFG